MPNINQLRRNMSDVVFGGVCSGIAKHLELETWIIRLAFVAAFVFLGIGPLIYIILWLLMPKDGE